MMELFFRGVFDAGWMMTVSPGAFLLCLGTALLLGLLIAVCSLFRSRSSRSFALTLALLPAVVCVVIMLVNGNIGTGVAVAGAFSLIRFRSAPGSAREICSLFIAMGAGLLTGMGYLGFAAVFTAVICGAFLLYLRLDFGGRQGLRQLRILIPEDLDYTGVFDDIFSEHLASWELTDVKTANMGSMFRLTYFVRMKDPAGEKAMIDRLRCRNGNLEIQLSRAADSTEL